MNRRGCEEVRHLSWRNIHGGGGWVATCLFSYPVVESAGFYCRIPFLEHEQSYLLCVKCIKQWMSSIHRQLPPNESIIFFFFQQKCKNTCLPALGTELSSVIAAFSIFLECLTCNPCQFCLISHFLFFWENFDLSFYCLKWLKWFKNINKPLWYNSIALLLKDGKWHFFPKLDWTQLE